MLVIMFAPKNHKNQTSHRYNVFLDLIAMICLAIIFQICIMDKMWFMIFKTYPSFCYMDHFRWNPNFQVFWEDVTIWKILYVLVVVVIALCY
jgi:ABC-type sugar transport system permease subunit